MYSHESLRSVIKTKKIPLILGYFKRSLCKKLTGAVFIQWQRKREQRIIVFMLNQKPFDRLVWFPWSLFHPSLIKSSEKLWINKPVCNIPTSNLFGRTRNRVVIKQDNIQTIKRSSLRGLWGGVSSRSSKTQLGCKTWTHQSCLTERLKLSLLISVRRWKLWLH